mmetsp:Transcript_98210/g.300285  ORF Transcript_98210/g.300285 Transcript_98210/m.300285 type:complete len:223 (+) Transcript_98210:413-1081(+)
MLTWPTIRVNRGTHATDMCRVLGKRRRRTTRSFTASKRNSRIWLTSEYTAPRGHTMAKQAVQRKCSSNSMYSLKGSCSRRSPSRRARCRRSNFSFLRASAASASPPLTLDSPPICGFSGSNLGGHLHNIRKQPTALQSTWKMSRTVRRRKRPGCFQAQQSAWQTVPPAPRRPRGARLSEADMTHRRQLSSKIGKSTLMPIATKPATSIGPFMHDSKNLRRTS